MTEPPPELPAPPEPQPLGDKSAGILLGMFQDFYRQELSAEEDVHRTLPFFATALGLIIAALSYVASQLPSWPDLGKACGLASNLTIFSFNFLGCGWPVLLSGTLLAMAALMSLGVLFFLAKATKRRTYDRIGPEGVHLARVRALQDYYLARGGLTVESLDTAVVLDLREQLLNDYAEVIPRNRTLTLQRYHYRALAVSFLLWSLFAAITATIIIVLATKLGLILKANP